MITNQPDVARGALAHSTLTQINAALRARLPMLDDLECCCHDDIDECACRKPRAGMLQRAASRYGLDLERSFVIGDSWRDTGAAEEAGCTSIQISRDIELARGHKASPDYWAPDILAASKLVIELSRQSSKH